jgi:uncharacterized protein YkwD
LDDKPEIWTASIQYKTPDRCSSAIEMFKNSIPAAVSSISLVLLASLPLAAPAADQAGPTPAPPAQRAAPTDPGAGESLRLALTAAVNAVRRAAGLPALNRLTALDGVAQRRAEEIGDQGALPDESGSPALFGRIQRQMVAAGYLPHLWTESVVATAGDAAAVVAWWKELPDSAAAMRRELTDLGVGLSLYHGVPLYVFLFAWPEEQSWQREAAPLRDLAAVRAALLAAVNAARQAAGRPPLAADPRLDAAAQAHAEDMLARSYYAHLSPEGSTPHARVAAAGFDAALVAENIAARHLSVELAMAGWMASSDHRRNILDHRFGSLGTGVAVGTYGHRYQVLWVMDLADRPKR